MGVVAPQGRGPVPPATQPVRPVVTGRCPVVESVIAAAEDQPGVTVRRGVKVIGLVSGPAAVPGVPHTAGVRTDSGERLVADLVIDAMGRRSPSAWWLAELGARPPVVQAEDQTFVYYTRFFTGPARPRRVALVAMGSFSLLTLDGDNDTWSVTLFGTTAGTPLKALRHPDCFTRVVRWPRARCTPTGSTGTPSPVCWPWPGSSTDTAASASTAGRS
jgi:2-polyprenyl-6-methoxyphenol hydroxylase-like FAD-dependent oxidoreductase